MARAIQNIKSGLRFGGARPSLFEVTFAAPLIGQAGSINGAANNFTVLCKAAQLPPSVQGVIEVPYQGRKIKVVGNRTFPEWTITIINDEDFTIRNAFESWSQAINGHESNIRNSGATSAPLSYKGGAQVSQLSKEGRVIRRYEFEGCWPSEVQAIPLDWGTTDAIEEFQVTLAYDMWNLLPNTPS